MRTLSATIPSALMAEVGAARIAKAKAKVNRTRVRVAVGSVETTMSCGTGHTLDELIRNVKGGYDGVRKLVGAAAYRSCRRAFATYDVQPASDMVVQIVDDTTEEAMSAVLDRFGSQYDPSKGAVSTWISHTVWFIIANYIRDHIIPNMMASSLQGHADRDGASVQQGADRFMADHAGKCHMDRDRLIDDEDMAEARKRLDTLSDRERTVLLSSLNDSDTDDALSVRMGLSRSALSQIRASLRDKGIESKRCKLH